jgi:hypothetical protein
MVTKSRASDSSRLEKRDTPQHSIQLTNEERRRRNALKNDVSAGCAKNKAPKSGLQRSGLEQQAARHHGPPYVGIEARNGGRIIDRRIGRIACQDIPTSDVWRLSREAHMPRVRSGTANKIPSIQSNNRITAKSIPTIPKARMRYATMARGIGNRPFMAEGSGKWLRSPGAAEVLRGPGGGAWSGRGG